MSTVHPKETTKEVFASFFYQLIFNRCFAWPAIIGPFKLILRVVVLRPQLVKTTFFCGLQRLSVQTSPRGKEEYFSYAFNFQVRLIRANCANLIQNVMCLCPLLTYYCTLCADQYPEWVLLMLHVFESVIGIATYSLVWLLVESPPVFALWRKSFTLTFFRMGAYALISSRINGTPFTLWV